MTIKVDDIFNFALRIRSFIPEEDIDSNSVLSWNHVSVPILFPKKSKNKTIINPSNYKFEYRLSYSNGEEMGGQCCVLNEEVSPSVRCDIEECIKKEIKRSCEEITDYEIFDIDKNDSNFQTAKVRVKAVK